MIAQNEELALQQQRQKSMEKKQKIKKHEQAREEDIMEKKKEAEKLKRFQELYEIEQTMSKQKKQEEKRNNMRAFQLGPYTPYSLTLDGSESFRDPGKLAAYLEEQTDKKEELISKTAAEAVAKKNKQRCEKEKMKAAMLRKLKYKKQEEKQNAAEMINASKAADFF
ncbi:hypothetical protein KOW79_020336 [Hemibagrus wyckioides]|uniref:Uncharacterized protein n=1 Tax=Hemibagrus wyckioides TaxID=337641 RepID=A0A9D3N702_9TELE|nr:hypothetical protein KOW79_020336 [Hemibagrus wyckioides]